MTFKSLQYANSLIETTPIKNKDYATVSERIKAFRLLYPNGSIETEIVSIGDGMVVMKATVKDDFGTILGEGHAYEKEESSFINKTSYIENCETSAVGRALGMLGIGINPSGIASAEEMENAIMQQDALKPISGAMVKTLEECIPKHGQTAERVCEVYGVQSLDKMNLRQFTDLMNRMGENKPRRKSNPDDYLADFGLPDDLGDQR